MVYTGKPSTGCENCRKAKKRCDQGLPSCGRCIRLGKTCGGYRDIGDLMFRDQSASIARRASATSEASGSASASATASASTSASASIRQPSPEKSEVARRFFFEHFVSVSHLSFLEDMAPDDFLLKAIMACAYAGLANRTNDRRGRETARRHYVDAISATNTALRHPRRVKEDNTLISVLLLGFFERLTWEGLSSVQSWKHHIQGSAQVLQLRGRDQIRTRSGAALFREHRGHIVTNALWTETDVPEYVVQWTQALGFDPMQTPGDQLVVLAARVALLRKRFRTNESTDELLAEEGTRLEEDLLGWSENTLAAGSVCSFYNIRDPDSPHSWNGTRHEYGIPQAHRSWNMWRVLRILLSRTLEAIWRRSWPVLVQPSQPIPDSEHYKQIRSRMTADICVAAAYAFGSDNSVEPPKGSISSGYLLVLPLAVAGTCLLEILAEPAISPGGTRLILLNEPRHIDPFNQTSTQLAWLIDRTDYISDRIGIQWATAMSKFLKGGYHLYYDLGRSRVVRDTDPDSYLLSEALDVSSSGQSSGAETSP